MIDCLNGLVKIKGLCGVSTDAADQMYFHQFVSGIPTTWLSSLVDSKYTTGEQLADEITQNATFSLNSQLQLLKNTGNTIRLNNDSFCNNCEFAMARLSSGNGISIQKLVNSSNSFISISKLKVKTNFTGNTNILINDGEHIKTIAVSLTAGQIDIFPILEYKSYKQSVRIYFSDPTIQAYYVDCPKTSGCGCSGSQNTVVSKKFIITGWDGNNITSDQYGIQPCITVGCDSDNLICNLIGLNKYIIAQYISYQIAKDIIERLLMSTNLVEEKLKLDAEMLKEKLSTIAVAQDTLLNGRKAGYNLSGSIGIADLIESYMKNGNDECVTCNTTFSKATASF